MRRVSSSGSDVSCELMHPRRTASAITPKCSFRVCLIVLCLECSARRTRGRWPGWSDGCLRIEPKRGSGRTWRASVRLWGCPGGRIRPLGTEGATERITCLCPNGGGGRLGAERPGWDRALRGAGGSEPRADGRSQGKSVGSARTTQTGQIGGARSHPNLTCLRSKVGGSARTTQTGQIWGARSHLNLTCLRSWVLWTNGKWDFPFPGGSEPLAPGRERPRVG